MLWLILFLMNVQNDPERLMDAARTGDLHAVKTLLNSGIDVNTANRYGITALFYAAEKGNLEMVRVLVSGGARVDVADRFYHNTPVSRALGASHFDVVKFLLSQGAPGADSVLEAAVRNRELDLAKFVLEKGLATRDGYVSAKELANSEGAIEILSVFATTDLPELSERHVEILSRDTLIGFVGKYQNDQAQRVLTVVLETDSLVLSGGPNARLIPIAEKSFELDGVDGEVVFAGRGGMVEALVLRSGTTTTRFRPMDEAESRESAPVGLEHVVSVDGKEVVTNEIPRPWGSFRGPNGSGNADGQGIPTEWSVPNGQNIRFATEIPGFSVASPIISDGRIFVITAVSSTGDNTFRIGLYGDTAPVDDLSEHQWLLFALDGQDGSVVWKRELYRGQPFTKRHTKSSQANATPVTDGVYVVTVLGSVGQIYCHSVNGELIWRKEIGARNVGWFYDLDYQWGHSSSPIIYKDSVILQSDAHNGSYIAAYRLRDGEELWRTQRDDEIPTFSTPAIYRGERDELVTNGTKIRGYDPKTGELLWFLGPNSEIPITVPVMTNELIYVQAGYPPIRPIYAIRPGSRGDLALPEGIEKSEALAWSKNRGGTYIPSPLVYKGLFYTNANNGRLTVYDAATGDRVYRVRIGGVGGSFSASPIVADERLFFTNEEGETFVVKAGSEYELLAKNAVDGTVLSTPAASGGLLVVRTLTHVYGISR